MTAKITGYDLSRAWFDWSYENPEKINPNHSALFFFCIEHCNRLGWKENFGLPSAMAKEAIGIKSYNTYINTLNDLIDWGFIKLIQKSTNQWSANIVALSINNKAVNKSLDKATVNHLINHRRKQSDSIIQSTGESISSIDKPQTTNHKPQTRVRGIFIPPTLDEVILFLKEKGFGEEVARRAFDHYALAEPAWTDTNGKPVRSWKQKMNTVWCKEENKAPRQVQANNRPSASSQNLGAANELIGEFLNEQPNV